jgi:hypothetical protein
MNYEQRKSGAIPMSVATVLKVFGNSSLVTEQGEFKISRVFPDSESALKAGYRFFTAANGVIIYRRRSGTRPAQYACVGG